MGRSKFKTIFEEVKNSMKTQKFANYVYGNLGAGKSHILMALGVMLLGQAALDPSFTTRCIIIPDCQQLLAAHEEYLAECLALTFCNESEHLWTKDENIDDFISRVMGDKKYELLFIVDQENQLDATASVNTKEALTFCKNLFARLCRNYTFLFGASANSNAEKRRHSAGKQTGIHPIDCFGGFTNVRARIILLINCRKSLKHGRESTTFVLLGSLKSGCYSSLALFLYI